MAMQKNFEVKERKMFADGNGFKVEKVEAKGKKMSTELRW
jgi:hypothetical protein